MTPPVYPCSKFDLQLPCLLFSTSSWTCFLSGAMIPFSLYDTGTYVWSSFHLIRLRLPSPLNMISSTTPVMHHACLPVLSISYTMSSLFCDLHDYSHCIESLLTRRLPVQASTPQFIFTSLQASSTPQRFSLTHHRTRYVHLQFVAI